MFQCGKTPSSGFYIVYMLYNMYITEHGKIVCLDGFIVREHLCFNKYYPRGTREKGDHIP